MDTQLSTITEIHSEYNLYPDIITISEKNAVVHSPHSPVDLFFEMTKETITDPGDFTRFIKSAENQFRASREYKAYKAYLIESLGINRCQYFGNITVDDASVELHHNILNLFDICILITLHVINTVGKITSFDLVQMLIQEHYQNNIGITFLSKTAHQIYTNDPDGYIPPEQTFGAWWNLLSRYKFGITYDIANKIIKYIKKFQDGMPISINIEQQEEMMNYAYFNQYGMSPADVGSLPYYGDDGGFENYGY